MKNLLISLAGAVLALSACGPAEENEVDETLSESMSALVTQANVPGNYAAVSKRLAIVKCSGACSVTYQTVSASGALSLGSGTFTCSGADCGDTAGTWAFPKYGDWRYLQWSGNNALVRSAKVGEASNGKASLTLYAPRRPTGVSGTFVDSVYFAHN